MGSRPRAQPDRVLNSDVEPGDLTTGDKAPAGDETMDTLFNGRIKLFQSRRGYRFTLDAVLLAHFIHAKPRDRIVDLGAGNGAISLMLAYLNPSAPITGVEIQPAMIQRARRNVFLNGLEKRIKIIARDVRAIAGLAQPESFDVAVCNPPYRAPLSGRVSPNAEKRIARHEFAGALEHFVGAGGYLLAQKGRMALVYPAFRSVDLLTVMRAAGVEPKRIRMVHSSSASEASLVLAEGVKGGNGGITVEPPLIVYDEQRRYAGKVAEMLAGEPPGR